MSEIIKAVTVVLVIATGMWSTFCSESRAVKGSFIALTIAGFILLFV